MIEEKKPLMRHKPMKGRENILPCRKASGDFKAKPLIVHHLKNSRIFKKNIVMESKILVMKRAECKACAIRPILLNVSINSLHQV